MATKKQKTWATVVGAIAGGLITYANTKPNDKDRWLKVLGGTAAGAAGGFAFAHLFGEPDDTLNYSCFDKNGKRVYEGICYEDRADIRITEHKTNGKKIVRVKFDQPKPRSEARSLEQYRIKRHKPKYNIRHNCDGLKKSA